jgi:hypothetical protein
VTIGSACFTWTAPPLSAAIASTQSPAGRCSKSRKAMRAWSAAGESDQTFRGNII